MLKLQHLTKRFGTAPLFTDLCMEVDAPAVLWAPSGWGKTTLLRCLNFLETADSGTLVFDGESFDLGRISRADIARLRKKTAFVFQNYNLVPVLNVYENIELPLLYMGVPASERKQRIEQAMERMAISHRAKHFPQQLSGGQQQRVAIARAVVANPKLILADEPTGNLDSKNGKEVMDLLKELNKEGTTIVMVTHNEDQAKQTSRTVRFFDGRQVG